MSFLKEKITTGARFLLLSCVAGAGLLSIIATGGGDSTTSVAVETGTLSIGLTDASTDEYQAVYVTIKEVQVHHVDGNWETVGYPGDNEEVGKTYNLLELVNGVVEQLVLTELEPGDFTQMRLILGDDPDDGTNILGAVHPYSNYIIDTAEPDPNIVELTIPSGFQTGIKLVHGFTISDGGETELVLDFIVQKSVVKTGSGKYILKPTIKVIDTTVSSATVSGVVTREAVDEETVALEGVTVSAQYYNEDGLEIQSSTLTDEDGNYKMILPEDISYHIVAYVDGYAPSCIADVVLEAGENLTDQNFTLVETLTGTVSGNISIENGVEDDSAILSIRQECGGAIIEVKSVTVGYNSETENWVYSDVTLPVGGYTGIASTDIADPESDERDSQQITFEAGANFEVEDSMDTVLDDILFPVPQ